MVSNPLRVLSTISGCLFLAIAIRTYAGQQALFEPKAGLPAQAQIIDQRTFSHLDSVLPSDQENSTTVCSPSSLFIP